MTFQDELKELIKDRSAGSLFSIACDLEAAAAMVRKAAYNGLAEVASECKAKMLANDPSLQTKEPMPPVNIGKKLKAPGNRRNRFN